MPVLSLNPAETDSSLQLQHTMARIVNVKRGGVVLPPWFHGLRVLQLVFALVVAGLTAYALSIHSGSLVSLVRQSTTMEGGLTFGRFGPL